jgi:hypothetical protein
MDKFDQKWVSRLFNTSEWAITIGQTTYYSCPKQSVNDRWKRHEDKHKEQWLREGAIKFTIKYLYYQLRFGYDMNPYEIEARKAA